MRIVSECLTSMLIKMTILIMVVSNGYSYPSRLVCYSQTKFESFQIYSYFNTQQPGFYVDVYPQSPLLDSNSLYLSSKGWKGINILSTKQLHNNFMSARQKDVNLLIPPTLSTHLKLGSLCESMYPQHPGLLTSSLTHLPQIIEESVWDKQLCRPEIIFIRKEPDQKINESMVTMLESKGYQQPENIPDFAIFVQKDKQLKKGVYIWENGQKKQIQSRDLVSFTSIIRNLASKLLDKVIDVKQITSNRIENKIQILFTNGPQQYIQIPKMIERYKDTPYFLLMQFDPKVNKLILPEASYTINHIKFEEKQQYFVVKYRHSLQMEDQQYTFFIYDHNFGAVNYNQNKSGNGEFIEENQRFVVEDLGTRFSVADFDGELIDNYNIGEIKQFQDLMKIKNQTKPPQNATKTPTDTLAILQQKLNQSQQQSQENKMLYNNEKSVTKSQKTTISKLELSLEELKTENENQKQLMKVLDGKISQNQIKNEQQKIRYLIIFGVCLIFCALATAFCTLCFTKRIQHRNQVNNGIKLQSNSEIQFQTQSSKKSDENQVNTAIQEH